jgi:hypothetical protein
MTNEEKAAHKYHTAILALLPKETPMTADTAPAWDNKPLNPDVDAWPEDERPGSADDPNCPAAVSDQPLHDGDQLAREDERACSGEPSP